MSYTQVDASIETAETPRTELQIDAPPGTVVLALTPEPRRSTFPYRGTNYGLIVLDARRGTPCSQTIMMNGNIPPQEAVEKLKQTVDKLARGEKCNDVTTEIRDISVVVSGDGIKEFGRRLESTNGALIEYYRT